MNRPSYSTEESQKLDTQETVNLNNFLGLPELQLIKELTLKHPEMRWLTGDVDATPDASVESDGQKTVGEDIFPSLGKDALIEFNRTAVGILCLYWSYDGSEAAYEKFVACQKDENLKLTRENFEHMHNYTKSIVPDEESFNALVVYTVINDLGKIHSIIEQIQLESSRDFALKNVSHESSINAIVHFAVKNSMREIQNIVKMIQDEVGESDIDHDKALVNGLDKYPDISPGFSGLTNNDQSKILTGLRGEFNMGQFLQAENLPANLKKLKGMDEKSFDFYMSHFLFDLAGAAGQFVQNGSVVLDNSTYEGFKIGEAILRSYIRGEIDELEAYDAFLEQKAIKLNTDIDTPENYALVKLACMTRIKQEGNMENLQEVFTSLGKNTKAILVKELNKNGVNDGIASLLYYSPALLSNLMNKLGEKEGLELGLTVLARIFQEARISVKSLEGNDVNTLMLNEVAKIASTDPEKLRNVNFEIVDSVVKVQEIAEIDLSFMGEGHTITNIEKEIPGKTIIVGGIGGGSDAVQAAQLARILEDNNKEVPFVFSVRTKTTGSQGPNGEIGEKRIPENAIEVIDDIFEIQPQTLMKGRAMEPLIAKSKKTYLILIGDGEDVAQKIDSLIEYTGGADTIIGVDTGGDALYGSGEGHDNAKTTPDQDLLVLDALNSLKSIDMVLSCEIAVGIDSPDDSSEVLKNANAVIYSPNTSDIENILSYYKDLEMDGSSDTYFGKTALAWQAALTGERGIIEMPLPESVVTDSTNPWNPYVHIQEATSQILFMKASRHKEAIKRATAVDSLF